MIFQIVCKMHFPEGFCLSQFTRSKIKMPSCQLNYWNLYLTYILMYVFDSVQYIQATQYC